jgi:hypothetical protein
MIKVMSMVTDLDGKLGDGPFTLHQQHAIGRKRSKRSGAMLVDWLNRLIE